MPLFTKKPVVVEAWTAKELNFSAQHNWMLLPASIRESYEQGGWVFGVFVDGQHGIYIPTLEGSLFVASEDFVIRGVAGEFYPCKPDIFWRTYEPVGAQAEAALAAQRGADAKEKS